MAQLNTKIVLRNDIYTAWESSNPVLLKGEIGVEFNPAAPTAEGQLDYQVKIKIGDGVNKWNDLPYFGGDSTVIEEITTTVENITKNVTEISNVLGNNETEGTVIYRIGHLEERVEALEGELANKANSADVYTKEEADNAIASAVANAEHLKRVIISQEILDEYLAEPSKAEKNVIYMVKTETLVKDSYQEFMRFDSESGVVSFEQIGDTSVNLADYATLKYVNDEIARVEEVIGNKADQSALEAINEEIAKKANTEDVNQALANKADKEQVAQDIATAVAPLADKADKSYVDDELAGKADEATTLAGYGITDAYTTEQVYTKSETDKAIADAVKNATGGESASDVLIALNNYKKAVNAELWGDSEITDEELSAASSRIDDIESVIADSNEIEIANIGTEDEPKNALAIKEVNVNKLVQNENEFLILYGGSASDNI